jgi:metal transporter CNNM
VLDNKLLLQSYRDWHGAGLADHRGFIASEGWHDMSVETITWIGMALLVAQSGMFSGLNLALFGVSALRLQAMVGVGNVEAKRMLDLRSDSNFLLSTILWGNVGTNVLLTMLSDSVMTGAIAFAFSTFAITIGGEIVPQAYFSRNALRVVGVTAPVLKLYQLALYPIAKPTALLLDAWLGREPIIYWPEKEIREVLLQHVDEATTDVDRVEGIGAVNFLALDDLTVGDCGEVVHPDSAITLPMTGGRPQFPAFLPSPDDAFLKRVQVSDRRWVLIGSGDGPPELALDAPGFLRAAMFDQPPVDPLDYCCRPIIVTDPNTLLGDVIGKFESGPGDHVIDKDLILVWAKEKRIITGADILGQLLTGIARPTKTPGAPPNHPA